jgi:hypothetical protein
VPNQAQAGRLAARRRPPAAARLLRGVYLATPLFALADLVFGINVRTPFFDATPALKWVYYPAAFAAGIAIGRWPRLAAHVGFAESGLNIALTILAVGLAYTRLTTDTENPALSSPFTPEAVAALPLSAVILILSYVTSQADLSRARSHDG